MYGDKMIRIFTEVKNIFNPDKKIATENLGGTKKYITSYLAEEHYAVHKV